MSTNGHRINQSGVGESPHAASDCAASAVPESMMQGCSTSTFLQKSNEFIHQPNHGIPTALDLAEFASGFTWQQGALNAGPAIPFIGFTSAQSMRAVGQHQPPLHASQSHLLSSAQTLAAPCNLAGLLHSHLRTNVASQIMSQAIIGQGFIGATASSAQINSSSDDGSKKAEQRRVVVSDEQMEKTTAKLYYQYRTKKETIYVEALGRNAKGLVDLMLLAGYDGSSSRDKAIQERIRRREKKIREERKCRMRGLGQVVTCSCILQPYYSHYFASFTSHTCKM